MDMHTEPTRSDVLRHTGLAEHGWSLSVTTAARALADHFTRGYTGPVRLRLWNGSLHPPSDLARCTLVFHHPGALRALVSGAGGLVRLAEAHLAGLVDVEGDPEAAFDWADHLLARSWTPRERLVVLGHALRLPRLPAGHADTAFQHGSRIHPNGRDSIRHHYDQGNNFYRLWLDPLMVYSCAYFRSPEQSLEAAQRDKLDLICRKLRLRPGQRLLDIGCGWGALILHAAEHYGVQAHGVTLSEEQHRWALERCREKGLSDRVRVELRDYRDIEPRARYDRIASVGMFEHVGVANLPAYFDRIRRLLRPAGLVLNHGITHARGWRRTPLTTFVNRHVFPDGELARLSTVTTVMEDANLEILDVESLRPHYALTLRAWLRNLEKHRQEAIAVAGEAAFRLWRLYMAGSAHYFHTGDVNVYQILAAPGHGRPAVPLRRDDIYHGECHGS